MQDIGKELFDASQISGDPDKIKYDMTKSGEDKGLILPYNGLDQKNTVLLPDTLGNLKYIFQDILDGNEEALNRPEFKALNFNNIKAAIEWLAKTNSINDIFKNELLAEGWRLNFKCRPPTPEEFLTEKYLGPTAETLYEPVRKAFIEFMNPLSPYRNAILSLHIGWGKSALSAIIQLYISTHFAMMWHPYKYFGQSSATVYIQALGAWSQKKGSEILLEPILNIINSSPYFKQVRGSKDITDEEAPPDEVANQLLWTTASKTSALTMQGGVNYKTVAGDKDIIGSSQPLDSDIYLPDGTTKKMGDLKVGDVIASPTEGSQTVLHIFPKPKIRCWKITLSDGRTVRCAADHMWKIAWQKKPNGKWDWQVKPFQFILDHPELKFEIWDKDNCDDIPYIWES